LISSHQRKAHQREEWAENFEDEEAKVGPEKFKYDDTLTLQTPLYLILL